MATLARTIDTHGDAIFYQDGNKQRGEWVIKNQFGDFYRYADFDRALQFWGDLKVLFPA